MSTENNINYFFNYKNLISCLKLPPIGTAKIELFRQQDELIKKDENTPIISIGEKEVAIFCGNSYQGNIYIKDNKGKKHNIYKTKTKVINYESLDSFIYHFWNEILEKLCLFSCNFSHLKEHIFIEINKETFIDLTYNCQPEEVTKEKIISENPHIQNYNMYYNIGEGIFNPLFDKHRNKIYSGMSQIQLATPDCFIQNTITTVPFDDIQTKKQGEHFIEKKFNDLTIPKLDELDILQ